MAPAVKENHVLLVTIAAQCHVNPMLRFGKLLLSKGLHVTLAIPEVSDLNIPKSSTEAGSSESSVDVVLFSDGMSPDYDRKNNLDIFVDTLGKFGPVNLMTLIRERYCDGKKLRCLIADSFIPWAAGVASELGILCAVLWTQPCALYAIYDSFYYSRIQFPSEDDPDISVQLPGLPRLATEDLPSFILPSNPFDSIRKLVVQFFERLPEFTWVLGNSFYELEKDVINSWSGLCPTRPILPVGPLVPPALLGEEQRQEAGIDMWKPEDGCILWLNQQAPGSVVYISFGSLVMLPAKLMGSIAVALKNTKRPFLWVVKPPETQSPDGAGELPPGFIEETKDQGRVVTWCPRATVLAHPAVACFVTHCGWSSMLETISSGIPLIAYPQWTDQPTNAKLITDVFKTGLRLEMDDGGAVTSGAIEKCIEEVMVGPRAEELRKNAHELKRAAREAAGTGGSSYNAVKEFVDEVFNYSSEWNIFRLRLPRKGLTSDY